MYVFPAGVLLCPAVAGQDYDTLTTFTQGTGGVQNSLL